MAEEIAKAKKPIHKRWWVWAVGVLGFIVAINAISGGSKDSQSGSNPQATQQQTAAIKVTALKLSADYKANEVAADQQYKNQLVEITGTIENIGKDILDTPYISLAGDDIIFGIQCMFNKSDASKLVNLSKNQKITLTGKVSGKLGNVLVKDCQIVE